MLKVFYALYHGISVKDQNPIFVPDMTEFPRHHFDEKSQGTPNQ